MQSTSTRFVRLPKGKENEVRIAAKMFLQVLSIAIVLCRSIYSLAIG